MVTQNELLRFDLGSPEVWRQQGFLNIHVLYQNFCHKSIALLLIKQTVEGQIKIIRSLHRLLLDALISPKSALREK